MNELPPPRVRLACCDTEWWADDIDDECWICGGAQAQVLAVGVRHGEFIFSITRSPNDSSRWRPYPETVTDEP